MPRNTRPQAVANAAHQHFGKDKGGLDTPNALSTTGRWCCQVSLTVSRRWPVSEFDLARASASILGARSRVSDRRRPLQRVVGRPRQCACENAPLARGQLGQRRSDSWRTASPRGSAGGSGTRPHQRAERECHTLHREVPADRLALARKAIDFRPHSPRGRQISHSAAARGPARADRGRLTWPTESIMWTAGG